MSYIGIKARVGHPYSKLVKVIHSLRLTSGVTPANLLTACMAADEMRKLNINIYLEPGLNQCLELFPLRP